MTIYKIECTVIISTNEVPGLSALTRTDAVDFVAGTLRALYEPPADGGMSTAGVQVAVEVDGGMVPVPEPVTEKVRIQRECERLIAMSAFQARVVRGHVSQREWFARNADVSWPETDHLTRYLGRMDNNRPWAVEILNA